MFARKLKAEEEIVELTDESLDMNAHVDNDDDFERDRIKSLITGLDMENNDSDISDLDIKTSSGKALFFALDVNDPKLAKNVDSPKEHTADIKRAGKGDNTLIPFAQLAPQESIEDVNDTPLNFNLGEGSGRNDDPANILSQIKIFADEVDSDAKDEDDSLDATDINVLSDLENFAEQADMEYSVEQEAEEAPFLAYLNNISKSHCEVDEKQFLAGKVNNVAAVRVINGNTYINQPVAEHIYSLAVIEIYNGQFEFAKAGLMFICRASTDQKYVNMALDLLQSSAACSKQELMTAINDTICKEEALESNINQLEGGQYA